MFSRLLHANLRGFGRPEKVGELAVSWVIWLFHFTVQVLWNFQVPFDLAKCSQRCTQVDSLEHRRTLSLQKEISYRNIRKQPKRI